MYQSILDNIFHSYPMYHRIGKKAYKDGMENIVSLIELLQHPEENFKTVHIAGSNGKGSVAHLLASFFQEAGYRIGLFTSPHLIDFRERIKINGIEISEQEVIHFFQQYEEELSAIAPSFFEVTVALAFNHFRENSVDIAIIEVGLGGRLDATNIITPELSIITNISLEHTEMLGDTLEKIAMEKAGIIKEEIPVIIGEYHPETFPVFSSIAKSKNSDLQIVKDIYIQKNRESNQITVFHNQEKIVNAIHSPLIADYQLKNIKTYVQATFYFCKHFNIDKSFIGKGLENVDRNLKFRGRWQILSQNPLTICDVGHNLACFKEILYQLKEIKYNHLHFIIGFVNDKELVPIFSILPKESITYYTCQAEIERALPIQKLNQLMLQYQLPYIEGGTVEHAYKLASQKVASDDLILIAGSTFIVGEFIDKMGF